MVVLHTRTTDYQVGKKWKKKKIQKEATAYAYHPSKILNPYLVGRHNDSFGSELSDDDGGGDYNNGKLTRSDGKGISFSSSSLSSSSSSCWMLEWIIEWGNRGKVWRWTSLDKQKTVERVDLIPSIIGTVYAFFIFHVPRHNSQLFSVANQWLWLKQLPSALFFMLLQGHHCPNILRLSKRNVNGVMIRRLTGRFVPSLRGYSSWHLYFERDPSLLCLNWLMKLYTYLQIQNGGLDKALISNQALTGWTKSHLGIFNTE